MFKNIHGKQKNKKWKVIITKYYVVSDVHGFNMFLQDELRAKGFFEDEENKLILCGDAFDRGGEAVRLEQFLMKLYNEKRLIYIRGNHEDLMLAFIREFMEEKSAIFSGESYHVKNGTFKTATQLAKIESYLEPFQEPEKFLEKLKNSDYVKTLIPSTVDYFETKNHIFTHGFIPTIQKDLEYIYNPDWRQATPEEWNKSRWDNGMKISALYDVYEPDKKIVTGHWHASYGHSVIEGKGTQFGKEADFSPFETEHLLSIDACTAYSHKVNCLVIEEPSEKREKSEES